MDHKILLLTACITPGGMPYTALQDSTEREKQYLHALRWYLNHTDFQIVMCENTNYGLPEEFLSYQECGRLEYLTFDGNDSFDKSRGKGVGESLIIQYAIENSKLIATADTIMKMTGRQILKNINFIAKHCSKRNCVYANTDRFKSNIKFAFSQFIISPKSFYTDCFLKGIDKLDDSRFYYFEHLLADSMTKWKKDGKGDISEFWMPLLIEGYSGSQNLPLRNPSFPWLRSALKYFLHYIGIYKPLSIPFFTEQQIKDFRKLE